MTELWSLLGARAHLHTKGVTRTRRVAGPTIGAGAQMNSAHGTTKATTIEA